MIRNTLTVDQAQRIARLLRERRRELGWSTRELAARSGASHGTVNLLERGIRLAPNPEILRRVGEALGISGSDLFAIAEWLPTDELPSLQPYLRVKYGLGSRDAAEINDYLLRLQARRGSGTGPKDREDEH